MSTALVWLTVGVAGALTFLQRASFLALLGRRQLPPAVSAPLRYVAPAAFAAIVAPRVVGPVLDAGVDPGDLVDRRVVAVIVAGALMWRFRSMPATLVVGMAVFWLLG